MAARALLAWSARRAEPAARPWVEALGAELGEVEGGWGRLAWALGGLKLVAATKWQSRVRDLPRTGWHAWAALTLSTALVLLLALGSTGNAAGALIVAGLTGLGFWREWRRHLTVVLLCGLTVLLVVRRGAAFGLGPSDLWRTDAAVVLYAVLVGLICWGALFWALPRLRAVARRSRALFAAISVAGFVGLAATIGLAAAIGGPASGFAVASFRDHRSAEAVLGRVGALDRAESNTVTPATLLGVEESAPVADGAQPAHLSTDFATTVQGYDLAGGVFPQAGRIGFSDPVPPGSELRLRSRLLDARDAGSLNVMIADDGLFNGQEAVRPLPGSTITVLGREGGRPLTLHVVGWFDHDQSSSHVFGDILADNSVVTALSGGRPNYTYGLRLDAVRRAVAFAALRLEVPAAQAHTTGDEPAGFAGWLVAVVEEGAQVALLSAVIVLIAEMCLTLRTHATPAAGR